MSRRRNRRGLPVEHRAADGQVRSIAHREKISASRSHWIFSCMQRFGYKSGAEPSNAPKPLSRSSRLCGDLVPQHPHRECKHQRGDPDKSQYHPQRNLPDANASMCRVALWVESPLRSCSTHAPLVHRRTIFSAGRRAQMFPVLFSGRGGRQSNSAIA